MRTTPNTRYPPGSWRVEDNFRPLESLNPDVSKQGVLVFDVPRERKYRLKVSGGYRSSENALIKIVGQSQYEPAIRAVPMKVDTLTEVERRRIEEEGKELERIRAQEQNWQFSAEREKTRPDQPVSEQDN